MTQVHVALVVPPAREGPAGLVRSGIGDYALELAAALRTQTTVRVYSSSPVADEWPLESLSRRDAEHVWWQLGNEAAGDRTGPLAIDPAVGRIDDRAAPPRAQHCPRPA